MKTTPVLKASGGTYVDSWDRSEPYVLTILNDGPTSTPQIKSTLLTFMDTYLSTVNDKRAVVHPSDMYCSVNFAAQQKALRNRPDCHSFERFGLIGGSRQINHAVADVHDGGGRTLMFA